MHTTIVSMLVLGGACLAPAGTAIAETDSEVQDLRDEVRSLRAEVAALRRGDGDDWLTEQRATQIRGLVHDVLADADTRASLLQGGLSAGHDGKFFLASADGNFRMNVQGQIQARFVYNNQDSSSVDEHRWGFENRRTKIKFNGHVVDPSWKYGVTGAFNRSGGSFALEDGFIEKILDDGTSIKFGQFKSPFMREELVSSSRQLAAERSLVNEEFNQGFVQGIQLGWSGDASNFKVMISDGFASSNVAALVEDVEFAVTARAEFLFGGTWKQFRDLTSWSGDDDGFLLGVAGHYEKAESGTASGPEEEMYLLTVDGSWEFGGANLFASFVYRDMDVADTDQYGFVVQGGWFVTPDECEVFARYEYGDPDTSSVEDLNVITVGVNRYYAKHAAKWTTDVGFGLDEVQGLWVTSGAGYRADPTGDDGQIVVRTQFQLLF